MDRKLRLTIILGTVSALAIGQAHAQVGEPILLDTIVIYGDRTTTVAEDSNSSVAIADARQLERPTTQTVTDAFRNMANVSTGDWTDTGFVLRGVNSEGLTPGGLGAPLASFYVDGVQQTVQGTRRGVRGTFDTEQLEVYRGPQSTLSGRAALAGAVYLRTKDPEFARSGAAQVTYGSDNHKQIGLAFGDAIGDRLAYRVRGEWSEKDSDLNYPSYRAFDSYDDYVTDDYWTLGGKLLWLPTQDNNTQVIVSYSRSFDGQTQNDIAGPYWSTGAPSYDARRGDIWGDILPDYYRGFGLTTLPVFQEVREGYVNNFGIELTHDFSDVLRLTAQTGWTESTITRNSINFGMKNESLTTEGAFTDKLYSQEIRLNYDDGALRWVAGGYAARETQDAFRNQTLLSFAQTENEAKLTNYALFGEAEYRFASGLRVIAGGRLDKFEQEQSGVVYDNGALVSDISNDFSDTVFIPKIGVGYDFGANQSVTLIYQEGYRPGGAGIRASDGSEYEYDAERTGNIELAWRGRFMDDRLRVGANIFHQSWDDQQVELRQDPNSSASAIIANAGESKSYGAEVELAYAATDMLDITASLGLLQTEFKDFRVGNDDFTGLDFPGAPSRNLALGFAWGGDTGWFANGNLRMQSSSLSRLETGVPQPVELSGFGTVDLAAGYGWDNAKLTAYATNLFDKEYYTYEYGPGAFASVGDRREIGMRLETRF
ncbi:TonB-dependent receptor [Paracoccus sp. SCSIO 75233]|uniref:TonB-dependent receptor n=1 Tax=Paracoccus sp. SCSIO 75233 TaxID=3017782 RepID=UPI0022F0F72B|nr:TonB-dependent receptor [Paracoccus sp. SCSIO 75233]WBU53935.1 TonB-dependent receptor [Paracoccus sp. SCSIO 75233]